MEKQSRFRLLIFGVLIVVLNSACSMKKKAVNTLADVLG